MADVNLLEWQEREKAALRAGALSHPVRKLQIFGLPSQWRERGSFDWTGCDAVEVAVGRVNGVPVLVGTRMPADNVLQQFEWGETPDVIAEEFGLAPEQVMAVLEFAGVLQHRVAVAA